jgi:hypothetical protein
MLRWLKTVVVSDVEKAHVMRQVGIGKIGAQSSFSGIAGDVSLLNKVVSKPGRSRAAPEGLLTRVRIEKVGGLGPWTS